jgi:hypothetical protein
MIKLLFLLNLVYSNEQQQMRDAGIKVLEIMAKDSIAIENAEKKVKLYYEENIPKSIKKLLVVVLPVAKIARDREIILIDMEF